MLPFGVLAVLRSTFAVRVPFLPVLDATLIIRIVSE